MNQLFAKISVLLLLPTFLLANLASASGFALCFAEDDHVEIEYVSINGHDDNYAESRNFTKSKELVAKSFLLNEQHGPCLDLSITQSDATFTKQFVKKNPAVIDNYAANKSLSAFYPSAMLVLGNFAPQPPPGISRSVLNHRTIVLLI